MATVTEQIRDRNASDGRISRLEANFTGLKEDVDHLGSDLRSVAATLSQVGKELTEGLSANRREASEGLASIRKDIAESKATPWSSIWSALGVGVVAMGMMGSGLVFFTNQALGVINNTMAGMAQKLAAHDAQIAANATEGNSIRAAMSDRMNDLATALRVAREGVGKQMVEIETQFCAQDEISNLRWAEQERVNAQMYAKAMGEPKVTTPYYQPHIGKCATPATGTTQ